MANDEPRRSSPDAFLGYRGDPDIHDGVIAGVQREGERMTVVVDTLDRRRLELVFSGVEAVDERSPVGMRLYALTELRGVGALRRFVFANSAEPEESNARLEILARDFCCRDAHT